MKKTLITLALALLTAALSAQEYLPEWQEGYLDIHTVATGRGDAAFVIMPDGTTMLIDAGDNGKQKDPQHPDGSKRAGEWLAIYLKHFMAQLPDSTHIDYAMLTHLHNDHMGAILESLEGTHGYRLSGITLVGDRIPIRKMVDRGYPDYDFPSLAINRKNSPLLEEYRKFIAYQQTQGLVAEQFTIGSSKQFAPVHDPKPYKKLFKVQNLCANGEVWTGKGLKTKKMYSTDPKTFDENMNSCAVRIDYGKFHYYNGGDLPGGNGSFAKSKDRDFESQVAPVCGPVTVMKANHHGYVDTCNGYFLQTLHPQVIIIDARSSNHPVPSTMTRFTDPLVWSGERDYYITVDTPRQKLGEELWSKFKPWGHIVVRVYPGGDSYQMFVLDADRTDYPVIYSSPVTGL